MRMVSPHWRSILLISGTISRNPRIKRLPRRTNLFLLIYVDSLSFVERKKDGSLVSLRPLFLSFDVYSIHLSLMIHNILNDNYARPSSIIVIMSIFIYFSNQIIDHPTWTRILYLLLLVLQFIYFFRITFPQYFSFSPAIISPSSSLPLPQSSFLLPLSSSPSLLRHPPSPTILLQKYNYPSDYFQDIRKNSEITAIPTDSFPQTEEHSKERCFFIIHFYCFFSILFAISIPKDV